MPVALRPLVPEKITSSMREPRKDFADCSPNTHEIASAIFDFPQPLGPMIAAMPSPWNFRSVRSQNDLNPRICSLLSLSNSYSFMRAHFWIIWQSALAGVRRETVRNLLTTWVPLLATRYDTVR